MSNKVDIKEFTVQLLRAYGLKGIHQESTEIVCQCPFHLPVKNFRTFRVSIIPVYSKNSGIEDFYFNCFSCGASGSIIRLIAYLQNCSITKAFKIFTKGVVQAGVTVKTLTTLLEQHRESVEKFSVLPRTQCPPKAKTNLQSVIYFNKRKQLAHGILNIDYIVGKYNPFYCQEGRYAGRTIMPIRDLDGRIVGFNDRSIDDDNPKKSLHMPGAKIGSMLYGLYENVDKENAILVEGAFDLFQVDSILLKLKLQNVFGGVCLMGTVLTDERYEMLTSIFDRVLVLLDNETEEDRKKAVQISKKLSKGVETINVTPLLPKGKDPGIMTIDDLRKILQSVGVVSKREKVKRFHNFLGVTIE